METDKAWLLFVEVASKSVPGSYFRLVNNTRNMIANGKTWQATSMKIELPEENDEGSLGQLKIAVPNVERLAMAYVEEVDDLIDQPATVILAHEGTLGATDFAGSPRWQHVITDVTADEQVAVFTCGHPAGVRIAPGPVFDRRNFPQLLPSAGQAAVGSAF